MTSHVDAIEGIIAFVCLLWVLYGPWQWVCTDYARQIIFERRDKLFDLAHAGKLEFSSIEYRQLRASFESLIRFGHRFTMARLLFMSWSLRLNSKNHVKVKGAVFALINNISDNEVRQNLFRLFFEVYVTFFALVVVKSPIFLALLIFLSPLIIIAILLSAFLGRIREWLIKVIGIFGEAIQEEANSIEFAC